MIKREFKKSKRSQEVFGMSFTMLFTIILIIFFIAVAFYAIRAFLNYQKCANIGFFFREIQTKTREAFNSQGVTMPNRTYSLPSAGITYVCFVNFSEQPKGAKPVDYALYNELKKSYSIESNLYLYAPEKRLCADKVKVDNIKFEKNPTCFKVIKNKVSFTIERNFDENFVRIS